MSEPRSGRTAIPLPDGYAVATGGAGRKASISAELYRAVTEEFAPAGPTTV